MHVREGIVTANALLNLDAGGLVWQRVAVRPAGFFHAILCALLLSACASGGNYRGYKYKPYTVKGVRYYPMSPREALGYEEVGIASYYSHGWFIFPGKTALGENIYAWSKGGAHKTLPLPCRVRVTNLSNGRSTVIRLNDRGPFVRGRVIDVTAPVAKKLGFYKKGLARVKVEVISVGDGKYRIR